MKSLGWKTIGRILWSFAMGNIPAWLEPIILQVMDLDIIEQLRDDEISIEQAWKIQADRSVDQ